MTDQLDEKIPLDTERGYHIHFKGCDHLISRPVVFQNRGFGITPMEQGLRVVGTVEFGGLKNPLSKGRIKNLVNNAKYMLDGLPEHEDEWLGFRPTLPDYLPVIGPSKKYKKRILLIWPSSFRMDTSGNFGKDHFKYDCQQKY